MIDGLFGIDKRIATMTSRCDVCHNAFTVIMEDGKFVDPEDRESPVVMSRGQYAHKSCKEREARNKVNG